MKTINDVKQIEPRNSNERMWFSYIANEISKAQYGKIELKLSVRNGKVVNIKNVVEKSYCVNS